MVTLVLNNDTNAADHTGSASDLVAFSGISTLTGDITATGLSAYSIANLKTVNDATTGAIVLNAATKAESYTASASDLADAFDGITSLEGDVTISGSLVGTVAQLKTINDATAGTLTLNTQTQSANHSWMLLLI